METYLPIVQQLSSEWLAWALVNQMNAGVLAAAVFFVTAVLYSFRVGFLKRQIRINDKANKNVQENLNAQLATAQQELQTIQAELVSNTEQMTQAQQVAQTETERAKNYEELVSLRNTQVSSLIQSLATRFDLGERPFPLMGDIKAEGLWQQHQRVTELLATRLQSEQQAKTQLDQAYQVETLQRRELESLRDTLQTTLMAQQAQLSNLEQALEEQKSILKIQQDRAEQALTEALAQSQAELDRIPLLEQQIQAFSNTHQHYQELQKEIALKDAIIAQLEKNKALESKVEVVAKPNPPPVATLPEIKPIPPVVKPSTHAPAPVIETPPVENKQELSASDKEPSAGISGKFKGLFAKNIDKTDVKVVAPEIVVIEPVVVHEEVVPPVKVEKIGGFGKLKGLFGKSAVEPVVTEVALPTPAPEPILVAPEIITPEPVVEVKESSSGFAGKFKGLLGKKEVAPVAEETVPVVKEPVVTPIVQPVPEPEVEVESSEFVEPQNQVDFLKEDIAKAKAMFNGLFGKKK
ncbi:MAG: hypothetical protein NTY69_12780 [Methylococcales bacterium]|nr:hypothetical protein [Methylococcales bacterium]